MIRYISTFPAGFEETAEAALLSSLPGAEIFQRADGLLGYRYEGGERPETLPFFSNTFFVLKRFSGDALAFPKMAAQAKSCRFSALGKRTGTFRVRYSKENQFTSVPKNVAAETERVIARATGLAPDRSEPDHEFWFVIRREGTGFFGFLLRRPDPHIPEKGELRPELAHLALRFAGMQQGSVFCDPFAGHGALPRAALESFSPEQAYISDTDPALVKKLAVDFALLSKKLAGGAVQNKSISISNADARKLRTIRDGAVDYLVTDPPWGLFEENADISALYRDFLLEAARILKPGGMLCVMTAKKEEFAAVLDENGIFSLQKQADILVNGKKARIFAARRKEENHG